MKYTRQSLKEISAEIYSKDDLELALSIFDEIAELGLDDDSKIIGFLCNADIDDEKKFAAINSKFPAEIINKIKLIKRISSISFPETNRQIENLRKIFINLTDDLSIIFIKLAEKLARLKFADKNKLEDVTRQSEEALYLYSPIAHRLGIRKIYNEMEEIAFKYLYPKEYKRLNTLIESKRTLFERKIAVMKNDLIKVLKEQKIEASIQSRVKRLYSIFLKIKNKGVTIDEIYDLLALRVITKKTDHCYLTLGVVHSNWIPIEGRFKDWITFPKPNGYRSIQTTVHTRKGDKYEIQIRTEEMHREAEYGSAAHWAYKEGKAASGNDQSLMKLKEFLENDDYFEDPFQLLESINAEMKRETINVLTPRGDIRTLTAGATPIDFAFTIHTDLGYRITGARINGKFAKLTTTLKSGDVVDIISNKNSSPSRDWLRIVKSSRARSKIMRWFKNNERDLLILDGKRAFERLKKKYKKQLRGYDEEVTFRKNVVELGFNNPDEFFFGIACNNVKCSRNLLRKLYPDAFIKKIAAKKVSDSRSDKKAPPPVNVEGLSGIKTSLAKCCNPMVGEDIVAYVSIKSDIRIHRKNCKFLYTYNIDEERIKKAEWSNADYKQSVKIKLLGEEFASLLLEAIELASVESISVLSSNKIKGHEDLVGLMIEVEVNNIKQLNAYINNLRNSSKVLSFKVI